MEKGPRVNNLDGKIVGMVERKRGGRKKEIKKGAILLDDHEVDSIPILIKFKYIISSMGVIS